MADLTADSDKLIRVDEAIDAVRKQLLDDPSVGQASRADLLAVISGSLRSLTYTPARTPRTSEIEAATDSAVAPVARVQREALALCRERESERRGVWRRSGLKGQTFHVFAKAERAFLQVMAGELPNRDHYLDLINYAAFAVVLLDAGQPAIDGVWPWA
jgi:hypothetical protein